MARGRGFLRYLWPDCIFTQKEIPEVDWSWAKHQYSLGYESSGSFIFMLLHWLCLLDEFLVR